MDTIDLLNDTTDAPTIGAKAKQDGRSKSSARNAANAGHPLGVGNATKKAYDPDKLADGLADRIIANGGIPRVRLAHGEAVTEYDRAHIRRITGIPAEEFQSMITARLQVIAEKTTDRVLEKLEEGGQKLSDLNMTLAISIDKLAAISGRTAQSGNVSVTVNNYGAMSRAEILAQVASEEKSKANTIEV